MATITKRNHGRWQAKVRRKGYPVVSKSFDMKARAERWARSVETEIDHGALFPEQKLSRQHSRKP